VNFIIQTTSEKVFDENEKKSNPLNKRDNFVNEKSARPLRQLHP